MKQVGLPAAALRSYPHELSGRMRQRAMIALCLVLDPPFVIFDEATSSLDTLTQRRLLDEAGFLSGQDGTIQFWHYSNAKVDQLLAAAERLTTQQERAENYRQAQALLAADLPTIPLCNQISPLVYSAKLSGMPLAGGRGKVGQFNYSLVKVIG